MSQSLTIYKASAGSGKTFTLTVEYIMLMLLNGPKEYEHTLAVTFTNKATAEMKDRILQTLYGLAKGLPATRDYMLMLQKRLEGMGCPMSEQMIREKAEEALHLILHDYNHFRVETIDAFFQSVLRNLAHELGLTANLQVELNNEQLISRAVDRVIDNMQFDPKIQQWVLDYVGEQMESGDRWDITSQVKSFARCIFQESFQKRSEEDRKTLNDERIVREFKALMHAIIERNKQLVAEKVQAIRNTIERQEMSWEKISNSRNYISFLDKAERMEADTQNTTMQKAVADPMVMLRSADRKNPSLAAQAENTARMLEEFLGTYSRAVQENQSARLSIHYVNPLRLLGVIEAQTTEINAENNQFNLSKTPTLLSRLIEHTDAPFVFEKIGTQLHNIMIDEFQDTSRLQWDNFKSLLLENQSTGGRDLLVGDVKQSIYRWRNGDWEILRGVRDEMKHLGAREFTLKTNFRSTERVVKFNNRFFLEAAKQLDALQPQPRFRLTDIYDEEGTSQRCRKEDGQGFVRIHLYKRNGNKRPENYEQRMVTDMVEQIERLREGGLRYTDMAILVRNKRFGIALINLMATLAPHITLVSDEAFLLSSSVAVQMLVTALRVLVMKKKNDPVPERTLCLHYLRDVKKTEPTMEEITMQDPATMLPKEFVERQEELRHLPLYLLVERLYRIFELEKISGEEAYLFSFYDELQNHLRSNPSDIHTFLKAWDESISSHTIPGGDIDGIRILTIHKSKGLEFHTVLLPFMDWTLETDVTTDNIIWCATEEAPYNRLGILPIRSGGSGMRESVYAPAYDEEHLQRRVESLNTIYVAFTRAEANLMVWGMTSGALTTSSSAADLICTTLELSPEEGTDEMHYEEGSLVTSRKSTDKRNSNRMSTAHLPEDALLCQMVSHEPKLDFQQSNQSKRFIQTIDNLEESSSAQTYLEIGKLMHYVLSQIQTEQDIERILRRCQNQGLIVDDRVRETVIRRIKAGFNNPIIHSWFTDDKTVYNECSITSIDPATNLPFVHRPDRVVMTEKGLTVIDFKFGRFREEHEQQVAQYMALLAEMYPEKEVKGYLWYIYSGQVKPIQKK